MIIESELGIVNTNGHICLKNPMQTKCCGQMRCFLINRDGQTRCVDCDSDYQDGIRK